MFTCFLFLFLLKGGVEVFNNYFVPQQFFMFAMPLLTINKNYKHKYKT